MPSPGTQDDPMFDPLAQVITPQSLAMLRYNALMNQYAQAPQETGGNMRNAGALTAGLSMGRLIGASGNPATDPMTNFANNNQAMLAGGPQQGGAMPASGGGGTSPTGILMAQAAQWDQRGQQFEQSGQYQVAQGMYDKANKLRAQAQQLQLQGNQSFEAQQHGLEYQQQVQQGPTELQIKQKDLEIRGYEAKIKAAQIPIEQQRVAIAKAQLDLDGFKQSGVDDLKDAALAYQQGIPQIDMARDILRRSAPGVVGPQQELSMKLNAALTAFGMKSSGNLLTDQAQLNSILSSGALANRPKGMTRLTNFDLEFLQKITGHPENLDIPSMMGLLNQREKIMRMGIGQYNQQAAPWAARGGILSDVANPIAAPASSGGWLKRGKSAKTDGYFYQFPGGTVSADPHADQQ